MQQLRISDDKRFLVHKDGSPCFLLGDTAFEILYRLTREEIDFYLKDRAARGFNLITASILSILEKLDWPNAYGHTSLIDSNPQKPNPAFFEVVDYLVENAQDQGIYTVLLPITPAGGANFDNIMALFSPETARAYGLFLGKRYSGKPVVWMLGGNRPVNTDALRATWRSMAEGLKEGAGGCLVTYLPPDKISSSEWLQSESWLDFNSIQTSHSARNLPTFDYVAGDYVKSPIKPTWEVEYCWESTGISWNHYNGRFEDYDSRKGAYWSLFAGGFGFIYGSNDVFPFYRGQDEIKEYSFACVPWKIALNQPGCRQMAYVRALMESRPQLTRIPDQGLLVSHAGKDGERVQATRDEAGRYAFVYCVTGQPLTIDLAKLSGDKLTGWWYDPRVGVATKIGEFERQGKKEFTPPSHGYGHDWILVLDDAAQGYPAPGEK